MANTPMVIVHSSTYEGNPRTGEHLSACLDHNMKTDDMCEIKLTMHVSFTPGHPAINAFMHGHNVLMAAIEMEKHVREHHADGSACPVAEVSHGKDWVQIERMGVRCDRGE